jgi:hypothetical protein
LARPRQSLEPAAPDHHAAILRGPGAAAREHGAPVPAEQAEKLPERARELIGYSIHPPFMGYVDGVHPRRLLRPQVR